MNLKEAIFRHLASLDGLSAAQVFQDKRSKDDADLENIKTRDIHAVFFSLPGGRVNNQVRTAEMQFEFHFLAHETKEDDLETARDRFRESVEDFSGIFGGEGGLVLHNARYDNEGESEDYETGEKMLIARATFNFVKKSV